MSSGADPRPRSWAGGLLLGLCLVWPRTGWVRGPVWSTAPSQAPGAIPPISATPLQDARDRYLEGDIQGVIAILTPWLSSRKGPWGRHRDAGQLLLGTVHMEAENWNLASSSFYRVRNSGGPLASYGAWFEALVDHRRGRHYVAIKECKAYRAQWPSGPEADECLLLIGDAYAATGARQASLDSYQAYLSKHPNSPRREEIRIAIALAEVGSNPERGIRALHELALHHSYPSTDLAVTRALESLATQGYETGLPDDSYSQRSRAESLRRSGQLEDAWEAFLELKASADDDEEMLAWVEENEERFARGTRNFDVYALRLEADYAAKSSPEVAWNIFRAWGRAGRWDKALEWATIGETDHGSYWRWRSGRRELAWTYVMGGQYTEAASRWEALSKRGGSRGRTARFYAGFCQIQAGLYTEAVSTLEPLTRREAHWQVAAFYWRAKAREALEDLTGAQEDRDEVRLRDRRGWYTLLLDERLAAQAGSAHPVHEGKWTGSAATVLITEEAASHRSQATPGRQVRNAPLLEEDALRGNALLIPETSAGWRSLSWSRLQSVSPTADPVVPGRDFVSIGLQIPEGYVPSTWFDPAEAEEDFHDFAEANKNLWPDLPAARDLALAGLYDKAARLIFPVYEEWKDVSRRGALGDPRRQKIEDLGMHLVDWRPILCVVRDHYHAARAFTGLDDHVTDEEDKLSAIRLAYPIVFGRELYELGRLYDVDPLLMLAIMRQESTYRNKALSPVGAIGLIQVMPATGARVARLLEEERYSPGDLEEPGVNLRYGTFYFSRLMARFDGMFPMAVASYNGGPHNLSRWYRGKERQIDMDVLVEQIMYDETRDYVKKVSGHYARYVQLYGDTGARVKIPMRPAGDDPSVIDF